MKTIAELVKRYNMLLEHYFDEYNPKEMNRKYKIFTNFSKQKFYSEKEYNKLRDELYWWKDKFGR